MAEELQLNIKVGGADSLASLKKEFKDLQVELEKTDVGSKEYLATLQKLGKVKDDIGDLRDTIGALNPEGKIAAFQNVAGKLAGGFQAATGAAALLGIQSEDLQKQLLKVQAATAFAEGIRSISGLGDAFAVVSTVIKTQVVAAFSSLKTAIATTGIGALVVLLGYLVVEFVKSKEVTEDATEAQKDYNNAIEDGNEALKKRRALSDQVVSAQIAERNAREGGINQLQRELSLLTAKGATETEINNVKRKIIQEEIANFELQLKFANKINLDQKELLDLKEKIKNKSTELRIIDEVESKARIANFQKMLDEMRISQEQYDEFIRKEHEAQHAQELKDAQDIITAKQQEDALLEAYLKSAYEKEDQLAEQNKAKRKADIEEINTARFQSESNAFNAFQGLSEAYFQTQLNSAKGNAAETDKIRKKQFETEKAFSIARAVIDGVRAVQGALAQAAVLGPFAGVLAASYGILAAANVAKIASTQYNSSSTGASTAAPTFAGVQAPIPTNPVGPQTRQDATSLDNNGYVINLNANVYEGQMTDKQRRVNGLQRRASFG